MPQNSSSFDLPINEVSGYVEDLLTQMGERVEVDGFPTTIMTADLQRTYYKMEESMKDTVFLHNLNVSRGSKVVFEDGSVAIVFTVPNDDLVSKSGRILFCNSQVEFGKFTEIYDDDPTSKTYGDIISRGFVADRTYDGYIERVTAREKQYDFGLLHETTIKFVTFGNANINYDDIAVFRGREYKIVDIDDIAKGILTVQLASVQR